MLPSSLKTLSLTIPEIISLIGKNNAAVQNFGKWSYLYGQIHTLILRILVKPLS